MKKKEIIVDFDNLKSMKKAERLQEKYIGEGLYYITDRQIGFNKFKITYSDKLKQVS